MLGGVPEIRDPLAGALVEITSRLADGTDATTVLRWVTDAGTALLQAAATGVMMVDPRGGTEVVSASDRPATFVEVLQTQIEQGPCVDCIVTGAVVSASDLAAERPRWPDFVPAALEIGYRAVIAIPLRLDGRAVGGLNLLYTEPTELSERQLHVGQVIADLAVLGLVQEPGQRRADRLAERTLTALNDRVLVDQAIGLIAGTLEIDPAAARLALAEYADHTRLTPLDVARAVTDRTLDPTKLATAR
jgi:GAF domain-containing protein